MPRIPRKISALAAASASNPLHFHTQAIQKHGNSFTHYAQPLHTITDHDFPVGATKRSYLPTAATATSTTITTFHRSLQARTRTYIHGHDQS